MQTREGMGRSDREGLQRRRKKFSGGMFIILSDGFAGYITAF